MEISRKITVAGINGVRKGFKTPATLTFLARVFGIANSFAAEGNGNGGVQLKFVGEFQAVSQDGKTHAAPVTYLPAPGDAVLAAAIKAVDGAPVKFAFDFYAEPDASSLLGYSMKVKPLLEPAPVSALPDLGATLPAVPLPAGSLSAPAPAPAASESNVAKAGKKK